MKPFLIRPLAALFAVIVLTAQAIAAEPEFIIGFPEDNMSNVWRKEQMNEIREELAKHPNVKFLMADAGGDVAKNIADIETMVAKGAQLLFLGPRNPDAIGMVVSRLRKQGIHIVLLTRKLNSEDYDTYISPDDFKIGYEAALFLAKHLGGSGQILMLEGVQSTTTAIQRKDGFLSGLLNYPNINIISKVADYSRAEAIRAIEEVLLDGQAFDAIYAHNDDMAIGARMALRENGIDPGSIPTVSIDFLPETKVAIAKGEQLASFTYPTCGKEGVAAAIKILNGKTVPRFIAVPFKLITKENVGEVEPIF